MPIVFLVVRMNHSVEGVAMGKLGEGYTETLLLLQLLISSKTYSSTSTFSSSLSEDQIFFLIEQ